MRLLLVVALIVGVVFGGSLFGPSSNHVGGQDRTDERLSALETTVAKNKNDIGKLRQRVATLEAGADSEDQDPEEASDTPPVASEGLAGWTIELVTVDTAGDVAADSAIARSARGEFLIVTLSITNEGSGPLLFPFRDMAVIDGEGRTFSLDEDATVGHAIVTFDFTPRTEELQPGVPYEYPLVFDVPEDAGSFVLVSPDRALEIALGD